MLNDYHHKFSGEMKGEAALLERNRPSSESDLFQRELLSLQATFANVAFEDEVTVIKGNLTVSF